MNSINEVLKLFARSVIVSFEVQSNKSLSHLEPQEITLTFNNHGSIRFAYWRLIEQRGTFSFLDHNQKYGGEKSIDAYDYLKKTTLHRSVSAINVDSDTGDINFRFENLKLQVLNLNAYENWVLKLPNGSEEYSNQIQRGLLLK